jgi:hypothetical protein
VCETGAGHSKIMHNDVVPGRGVGGGRGRGGGGKDTTSACGWLQCTSAATTPNPCARQLPRQQAPPQYLTYLAGQHCVGVHALLFVGLQELGQAGPRHASGQHLGEIIQHLLQQLRVCW